MHTSEMIKGSIKLIVCNQCSSEFPLFAIEVETDTGGIGLISAGKCNQLDVVIAEVYIEEWDLIIKNKLAVLPERLNEKLTTSDYRIVHVKRIKKYPSPPAGIPFSEYKEKYKALKIIYYCPCCGEGEASLNKELTIEEFNRAGVRISVL